MGSPNVAEREVTDMEIRAAIKLALADGPVATKEKLKERVTGRRERVYAEIDTSFLNTCTPHRASM